MPSVPYELLQLIADDVEDESLPNLRLASRTLNSVATPLVFRVVTVHDSVRSAEALSGLQSCDKSVTNAVQELIFKGDPEEDTMISVSEEPGRDALARAFSRLGNLSNLVHLRFDFHQYFEEDELWTVSENPSHFLRLQLGIFRALAENPIPALVSLTLNNVIGVPDYIHGEDGFLDIFQQLKTLSISVIYEGYYCYPPIGQFWDGSVRYILDNAVSLTSLTLRSDEPVGVQPALSFENALMPYLKSLSLHNFALDPTVPEYDVVEFIICHKRTLTQLTLDECSIDGGSIGDGQNAHFDRPWGAVLRRFEAELSALQMFSLTNGASRDVEDSPRDPRFCYTYEEPGFGYITIDYGEVVGEEDDEAALESLMATVEARRTHRC
ncbi:hypothetical protein B0H10DRAFT_1976402 [Mycena sp. CBHHK59/15]|nr:hypothetical protein B0H10DRAFT_1976402 [Mycena sp. CBHHK59/15]